MRKLAFLIAASLVISAGLVFLAVLADRVFGFNVGPRQWVGVCMTALGLALLAITLPGTDGAHSSYSHAAMISFEGVHFRRDVGRRALGPGAAMR